MKNEIENQSYAKLLKFYERPTIPFISLLIYYHFLEKKCKISLEKTNAVWYNKKTLLLNFTLLKCQGKEWFGFGHALFGRMSYYEINNLSYFISIFLWVIQCPEILLFVFMFLIWIQLNFRFFLIFIAILFVWIKYMKCTLTSVWVFFF